MKTIILLMIALLSLILCCKQNEEIKKISLINPPIPGLEKKFTEFSFNAEKGDTLKIPSGTSIYFPPNCLLDSLGKKVVGNVQVKYREFHDAVSIYLGGIPMNYDVHGEKKSFETAGMFELRAYQNGQKLFLDSGKKVNVRMASFESGADYNFFLLDQEKEQKWLFMGDAEPEINTAKVLKITEIEKMRPVISFPLNDNYFVLDYSAILDVAIQMNWEIKDWQQDAPWVKAQAKKYNFDVSNVKTREALQFKGRQYIAALMLWKNLGKNKIYKLPKKYINGEKYVETSLIPNGNNVYTLVCKDYDTKKIILSIQMEAVMPLKALFSFSPNDWKTKYDEMWAKFIEEEKKIKSMADVFRTFEVMDFGIYNWDKFIKEESSVPLVADFFIDFNKEVKDTLIVLMTGNRKGLVKYPKDTWDKFSLVSDSNAVIFTLLPDKRISVFGSEKYRKIDFNGLKAQGKPTYKFNLKKIDREIKSEDDLKEMLGIY